MRRKGLLLVVFLLFITVALPLTYAQDGGVSAPASEAFEFPRDHLLHNTDPLMNQNYIEWLYYTGIVQDETGRQFGYQITLFSQVLLGQQAYLYDVALSDLRNSQFLHFRGNAIEEPSEPMNLVYSDSRFQLELTEAGWQINFDGDAPDMGTGEILPLHINFLLSPQNYDYYLHGPGGAAEMGNCNGNPETFDGYTYYYSHPALTTTGDFAVGDEAFVITGETWFDHQWGNYKHCNLAWNWFSLRLDDGRFMMLFQFLDEDGQPLPDLLGASYLDADGTVSFWVGQDDVRLTPTRFWTHPEQAAIFALEWVIETPVGTFAIEPYFDNQTPSYLAGIPFYWEGVIRVRADSHKGQQIGMGYLEVVPRPE